MSKEAGHRTGAEVPVSIQFHSQLVILELQHLDQKTFDFQKEDDVWGYVTGVEW